MSVKRALTAMGNGVYEEYGELKELAKASISCTRRSTMGQKGSPVTHYSGAGSKRQLKAKRAELRGKSRRARRGGKAGDARRDD